MKIILASASPRRRELLSGLGVDFKIDTQNNFKEDFNIDIPHEEIPARMSEGKSMGFHRQLKEDEVLITSDTMVLCDGTIMGKPDGREDAFEMLKALSGKEHRVITAITVRGHRKGEDSEKMITRSDTAYVRFRELTDEEIYHYIDNYKPFDKAGAYGIQEWIGYMGITSITGSYFTIMGFPTHLVYETLKCFE